MKKIIKVMLGVTLLEIMLVLAIAALIIVMSIRYYNTTTYAQQTNDVLGTLQAITAAADNLAQGQGSYKAATNDAVTAVVGAKNMQTPWDNTKSITITSPEDNTYKVTVPGAPSAVCTSLKEKLNANPKFTNPNCGSTGGTGDVTYTYDSSKS